MLSGLLDFTLNKIFIYYMYFKKLYILNNDAHQYLNSSLQSVCSNFWTCTFNCIMLLLKLCIQISSFTVWKYKVFQQYTFIIEKCISSSVPFVGFLFLMYGCKRLWYAKIILTIVSTFFRIATCKYCNTYTRYYE